MNNKTKLTVGASVIAALLGTKAIVSVSIGNGADDSACIKKSHYSGTRA
ncbi:hypothetical protein [Candidatus Aquiluna sp. UB-MaderosW2red]|jgi:hypothetical protein|nr:hypothetical protein [Candidatus Aquiluna sp. UB-MaderosW2red]SCX05570.1 hypothetical protein SAMN05216534_0413 [Candidatus Aquiluna sp. UB-MaderosW2red]